MGIGKDFQQKTRYVRGKIPEGYYGTAAAVDPFKQYPDAPRIILPRPAPSPLPTLREVLEKRRSSRSFMDVPLTIDQLSYLLWCACGASGDAGGFLLRTAPSAGALYPIETYVGVARVEGLSSGLYHYSVRDHALRHLRQGDLSGELCEAALGQSMVGGAGAVFLWTAVFGRSAVKYLERAYRYVYLDAGHIAQNLLLAATATDLAACPIAALYDDEVNAILGVDGDRESILYMAAVGRPARTR